MPSRRLSEAALAVLALAATALVVGFGVSDTKQRSLSSDASSWRGLVGGVAANSGLRAALPDATAPPLELCTDNAAMIASAARYGEAIPPPGYLALDAYASAL